MASPQPAGFLRYWGSHVKNSKQIDYLVEQSRAMVARGFNSFLVLSHLPDNPLWRQRLEAEGISLFVIPRPRGQLDLRCIWITFKVCRGYNIVVFHCDNIHTSPLLGAYLARVRVRLWFKRAMNHHFEELRPATLKERISFTTRLSVWLTTRVVAISRSVKKELVQMGIGSSRVLVRLNPSYHSKAPTCRDKAMLRKSFAAGDADVLILTIGHASAVKGWDLLVRAYAVVAREHSAARLLVVGPFPARGLDSFFDGVLSYVESHHLQDRVRFVGRLDDVTPALQAADIFVLPSRSEGFGNVLVEAMQERLPIVAFKVGIAEDLIKDGMNGLLVERGDVTGLGNALARLIVDHKLRCSFRRKSVIPGSVMNMTQYAEQLANDAQDLLLGSNPACEL